VVQQAKVWWKSLIIFGTSCKIVCVPNAYKGKFIKESEPILFNSLYLIPIRDSYAKFYHNLTNYSLPQKLKKKRDVDMISMSEATKKNRWVGSNTKPRRCDTSTVTQSWKQIRKYHSYLDLCVCASPNLPYNSLS